MNKEMNTKERMKQYQMPDDDFVEMAKVYKIIPLEKFTKFTKV